MDIIPYICRQKLVCLLISGYTKEELNDYTAAENVQALFSDYTELRIQENRHNRITLLNGDIVANAVSANQLFVVEKAAFSKNSIPCKKCIFFAKRISGNLKYFEVWLNRLRESSQTHAWILVLTALGQIVRVVGVSAYCQPEAIVYQIVSDSGSKNIKPRLVEE